VQQQQMGGDFYRPQFYNQAPNVFNKPIRFNINAPTKVNPIVRNQNNSHFGMMNSLPNAKKRKNKKNKNKNKKNGQFEDEGEGYAFSPPLPSQPSVDLSNPPPPPPFETPTQLPAQDKSSEVSDVNMKDLSKATDGSNPMEWPQSLYNYVARCYMKCHTPLDKDMCEITLKGKITMAANRGELFTKDWENEAMPILHSDRVAQQKQASCHRATRSVPERGSFDFEEGNFVAAWRAVGEHEEAKCSVAVAIQVEIVAVSLG
jgi:SAC3 family protein LENG8/THP3